MSLTHDQIKKVAHLARLHIPEKNIAPLSEDLDRILKLVAEMNQVDTNKVMPMSHPLDETQPIRNDQITETNQRELFQKNAPQVTAGLYIVPQVVETE